MDFCKFFDENLKLGTVKNSNFWNNLKFVDWNAIHDTKQLYIKKIFIGICVYIRLTVFKNL